MNKLNEPIFSDLILTTPDGRAIRVFTEEEVERKMKIVFWHRLITIVNLLMVGFMAGFAVASYVITHKTFWV